MGVEYLQANLLRKLVSSSSQYLYQTPTSLQFISKIWTETRPRVTKPPPEDKKCLPPLANSPLDNFNGADPSPHIEDGDLHKKLSSVIRVIDTGDNNLNVLSSSYTVCTEIHEILRCNG